jgi:hypothetical protein
MLGEMMSQVTLRMELKLPIGRGESDKSSCLIRPFLRLLQTGTPPGKVNYIFYRHVDETSYNLGSLCYSEGSRIIFFPGFQARDLLWRIDKKGDLSKYDLSDFAVDHFTLNRDFKKTHLTLLKKHKTAEKESPATFKTLKLDGNIYFWFGLSIQRPSLLEPTPENITISAPTPSSDAKRRMREIVNARKDAIFHIVEQADKRHISSEEFIHFNFFICPGDVDVPKERVIFSLPTKRPVVSNYRSDELIPCRQHRVALTGTNKKIVVTVSRHYGKLKNKILTAIYEG